MSDLFDLIADTGKLFKEKKAEAWKYANDKGFKNCQFVFYHDRQDVTDLFGRYPNLPDKPTLIVRIAFQKDGSIINFYLA